MNMSVWSTWVEIHVCLQRKTVNELLGIRSTWVEIHVCLQLSMRTGGMSVRSTWVEIHVCLQRCKMKKNMMKDLHE